jgi:hypothetical protein
MQVEDIIAQEVRRSDQQCTQLLNVASLEKWTLIASISTDAHKPIILDKDHIMWRKDDDLKCIILNVLTRSQYDFFYNNHLPNHDQLSTGYVIIGRNLDTIDETHVLIIFGHTTKDTRIRMIYNWRTNTVVSLIENVWHRFCFSKPLIGRLGRDFRNYSEHVLYSVYDCTVVKTISVSPSQDIVVLPRSRLCIVFDKKYVIYDTLTMEILKVITLPRSTNTPVLVDDHTLITTQLSDFSDTSMDDYDPDLFFDPDYFFSIDIDQGTVVKEKSFSLFEVYDINWNMRGACLNHELYAIGNGYAALENDQRTKLLIIDRNLNFTVFQTHNIFLTVSVEHGRMCCIVLDRKRYDSDIHEYDNYPSILQWYDIEEKSKLKRNISKNMNYFDVVIKFNHFFYLCLVKLGRLAICRYSSIKAKIIYKFLTVLVSRS